MLFTVKNYSEKDLTGLPPLPSSRHEKFYNSNMLATVEDHSESPSDPGTNVSAVDPEGDLLDLFPDKDAFCDALKSFFANHYQNANDASNHVQTENYFDHENDNSPSKTANIHAQTTDNNSTVHDFRDSFEDLRKAADSGDILAQWRLKRRLGAKEHSSIHVRVDGNANLTNSTNSNKTTPNYSLPISTSNNFEYLWSQFGNLSLESNSQLIHLMAVLLQKAIAQPQLQREIQGCNPTSQKVVLREIGLQCHPAVADKISGPCQKTGKVHSNKSGPKTSCRSVGVQLCFASQRISRECQTESSLKYASIGTQCDLQPLDSALVQKPQFEKDQSMLSSFRGNVNKFEEPGSKFIPVLHNTPQSSLTTISSLSPSPKGSVCRAAELDGHPCCHSDDTNVSNPFRQKHIQLNDDLLKELLKARSSCAKKLKIIQEVLQQKRDEGRKSIGSFVLNAFMKV